MPSSPLGVYNLLSPWLDYAYMHTSNLLTSEHPQKTYSIHT